MTHEETSRRTKQAMAASLKRHMETKPLSKITISAICNDCGINRKTFYYHFKDIYDLLKWTVEAESLEVIKRLDVMVDYEKIIHTIMDYVDDNRRFLVHAYSAIGKNGFEQFFHSRFRDVSMEIIEAIAQSHHANVPKEYKDFLCRFYSNALYGLLVTWFQERNHLDRERFAQDIVFTLKYSIHPLLDAYEKGGDVPKKVHSLP